MKNLLKGFVKFPIFLFFVVISLFLLSSKSFNVLGQENTGGVNIPTEAIINVDDFKASEFTSDQALLFVQESSEASQDLLDYIETFAIEKTDIFRLYIVDVPKTGSVFTEYSALYNEVCQAESLLVPTLIYKDVCVFGYEDIAFELGVRFELEKKNVDLKEAIKENVDIFDSVVEEYNAEIESKTFIDWVKSLDTQTFVIIGVCFVLAIGAIVLVIVFKDKLQGNKKLISSIVPVLILVGSTGYLLFQVNSVQKDFAPLESSAGCIEDNNCATFADRVADGLNSDDVDTRKKYEETKAQMEKDEEMFGSNAAHLKVATPEQSTLLPEIYGNMNKGDTVTVGGETYRYDGGTFYNSNNQPTKIADIFVKAPAGQSVTTSSGKVISSTSINQFLTSSGKVSDVESSIEKTLSGETNEDGPVYCTKDNKVVPCSSCGEDYEDCLTYSQTNVALKYDGITGTSVLVPTGKAIIDPCEGGEGNDVKASMLCNCGNGIWTSAWGATTCDAVCRVENLICDDCNPEEPPPPEVPPSGGPYCGDGILGNTEGEECEYKDPDGVTCSWNVCDSTCKCPEIEEPYCGDGIINNDFEECELGDPDGLTCSWDNCNHVLCKCVEPGCGDGVLDEGESCERGDPDGFVCLWDTECNQLECSCKVEILPTCGDGVLDSGEYCEEGNPDGVSCQWDSCSKATCTCPSPQASIFDDTQQKMLLGLVLIVLGFLLTPFTKLLSNYYMKIGNGMVRFGKKMEKERIEKFENKVLRKK